MILLGAAIPFSVLSFNSETRRAILECPEIELVKLRTALTLQDCYQGKELLAGVSLCHLSFPLSLQALLVVSQWSESVRTC